MSSINLELIIDDENWRIVLERTQDKESYYRVNTKTKTLLVHNYDLEKAKYQCWREYKIGGGIN